MRSDIFRDAEQRGITCRVLASASGFDVEGDRFVGALLSAPGLVPSSVRCQDRRVALGKARQVLGGSLRHYTESWAVDMANPGLGTWAWAMAEHLVASRTNNFDVANVSAAADSLSSLSRWFQEFCEAARAECGLLDAQPALQAMVKIPIRSELHKGLPNVAWMTWLGPQVLATAPALAGSSAWSRVVRSPLGALCFTGDAPPNETRRNEIRSALGEQWFHPNATAFKFDLSGKNTITPAWLTSDKPPGGMIMKAPRKK